MSDSEVANRRHDHAFGQDRRRAGERRTALVIGLTATMMVVEIVAGVVYGSMALLADGLHMMSHAAALGIAAFAYVYARQRSRDERFSFGTGKVNSLAGFAGAVLLAVFAAMMAIESVQRILAPVTIAFSQAILVAVMGLIVNAVSALILNPPGRHDADGREHRANHDHHHHDHNLRAAYLHVLADALTSVLAIVALMFGKFAGLNWMDPVMGVVGALLVAHWSVGLLRSTGKVLLDRQAPAEVRQAIRESLESPGDCRVIDLHVWSIGSGQHAVIVVLVSADPRPVAHYRALLPKDHDLAHVTLEVHGEERDGERA